MDAKDFTKKESPCERKSFCDMESIFSILRGDDRIRTGDQGFADPCLTTWLRRRVKGIIAAGPSPDKP